MAAKKKKRAAKRAATVKRRKQPQKNGAAAKSQPAARIVDLGDVDDADAAAQADVDELVSSSGELADGPIDVMALAASVINQGGNGAPSNGAAPVAHAAELVDTEPRDHRAAAVAGGAVAAGFNGAKLTAQSNHASTREALDTLLVMLPADWADDEDAQRIIKGLDDAAIVAMLAMLAAQWRDGYQTAVNDHDAGRDFVVAPGRIAATG